MSIQQTMDQHEEVRRFVEEKYPGHRVMKVSCISSTEYMQPRHSLLENPDYIPVYTQLEYKVRAVQADAPVGWLYCDLVWVDGELKVVSVAREGLAYGLL